MTTTINNTTTTNTMAETAIQNFVTRCTADDPIRL